MAEEKTLDALAQDIAKGTDEARLALAQQLKAAKLWTGKVSSKFDIRYYNALVKLDQAYQQQIALDKLIKTEKPLGRFDVLKNIIADGGLDGKDTGPTTTRQTYVTSATQTAKLLDTVAEDLLERKLTKAEKAKYLKILNAEQRRQPSIQTTGKGFSSTQGGVDEQQFIEEKIAGTAEAKTARATDAYSVMLQELGGLR
jgi:murein DD-endopeptidase MepM/ murein hydrolase activator NlpD